MRISDWSSDVCSSDLQIGRLRIAPRLCDEALLEVFTATAKAVVGGRGDLARDAVIVATFAVAATELGDLTGLCTARPVLDRAQPVPGPAQRRQSTRALHSVQTDRKSTRLNSSH